MTNDEFKKHFSILLKSAISYAILYTVHTYLEYYELKRHTKSILSYNNTDEIKRYEREMKYYDNLHKELEKLLVKEIESESLIDKFKIMKMFNELMYVI